VVPTFVPTTSSRASRKSRKACVSCAARWLSVDAISGASVSRLPVVKISCASIGS
jgi:hypothetical protein